MVAAIVLIHRATVAVSSQGYADSVHRLALRSVLSEYDRKLYSEYGIFGFKADEAAVNKKVENYADASLASGGSGLLKVKIANRSSSLKGFSLLDAEQFRKQIAENEVSLDEALSGIRGGSGSRRSEDDSTNRIMKNEIVIEGLPSGGYQLGDSLLENVGSELGESLEVITNLDVFVRGKLEGQLVDRYMFSHFNSSVYKIREDGFFQNELEYILEGGMNDEKNKERVLMKIKFARIALNAAHIESDQTKMAKVRSLAAAGSIVGPGGAALAEAALVLLWSTAEAENDIKLLERGKKVPFTKTAANFALTNPKKAIDGALTDKVVYPRVSGGQDYFDYLKVLLLLADEEEKLARIMDLIQINMKNKYNENFLLRDYYAGVRLEMEVDGNEFSWTQKY
jgi:hypothetical protein